MAAPVTRFEIVGGKGNQLEKFYGDLFGLKIDSNNPMKYGMVDTRTQGGINRGVGSSQDGGNRVSVYAQVEDQGREDRWRTILPPSEVPGGPKLAMFADPADNVTGILLGK
jgi:predicted enzyme related to lactoylglutathione lyase